MATYELNQRGEQKNQADQSGRVQTANDNSGQHGSVFINHAGGNLAADVSSASGGIGQAMSDLPTWVWIAGAAVLVVFFIFRRKKK